MAAIAASRSRVPACFCSKTSFCSGGASRPTTLAEARHALGNVSFDFALLDVNLPDGRSLRLLEEKILPASVVTLVMTAEGG